MVFPSVDVLLLKLPVAVELVFVSGPLGEGVVTAWLTGSRPESGAAGASLSPLLVAFEAATWSLSDDERTESKLTVSLW